MSCQPRWAVIVMHEVDDPIAAMSTGSARLDESTVVSTSIGCLRCERSISKINDEGGPEGCREGG